MTKKQALKLLTCGKLLREAAVGFPVGGREWHDLMEASKCATRPVYSHHFDLWNEYRALMRKLHLWG